jgi:KDO2-lipid IV(A) lauroyltransferase
LPDTGDRQADIEILTQALNDRLEYWVREQPHSWLWLHRRFPKDLYRRATIAQQRSRRAV